MSKFLSDLKRASKKAAFELRKGVTEGNGGLGEYWEGQRLEAQLVAEIYHQLRISDYEGSHLVMEYWWQKTPRNSDPYKLKADLIFINEETEMDTVVEVKPIWDGDLKADHTASAGLIQNVKDDYDKLIEYSVFSEVEELALVVGYLGPEQLLKSRLLENSIRDSLNRRSFTGRRGQEIELIVA